MLAIIQFIPLLFQVYTLMLFARILTSWLPELYEYRIVRWICFYTDPYLNFFRQFIPPLGMIDFSPIVAFLCLNFAEKLLMHFLWSLAA